MIESNKCTKCKYTYEVTWDDDGQYYNDYDETYDDNPEEDLYPDHCPFCGTHKNYCDEEDASDIF